MKEKFIFLLFTVVFFLNTQLNFFHLIPYDKFEYSRLEESETLIIGKLINSQHGSIFDDGGFTGTFYYDKISGRRTGGQKSYEKYIRNESDPKYYYDPYKSQIGGQAILYSIFDKIFGLDNKTNILIYRIFNSLALSAVLALFLLWVMRKFGIATALILFLLLIFNYWIFLYGKSTWWCSWVYFLPFVYGLFFFERHLATGFKKYVLQFSILFFIKFWFTGFEFITVFLICSAIPYIHYLFDDKISFYIQFIKRHFIITALPLIGCTIFQLFQFKLLTGSFTTGIQHLVDAYTRRSSEGYSYEKEFSYLNDLKKYHLDIIIRYMGNSFVNENITSVKIPFIILISAGALSSVILLIKKKEKKLVGVTWFSAAAPLSWLILFKEHAHIHKHIDFFIWYCPFLILILLLISLTLNFVFKITE